MCNMLERRHGEQHGGPTLDDILQELGRIQSYVDARKAIGASAVSEGLGGISLRGASERHHSLKLWLTLPRDAVSFLNNFPF